MGNRRREDKAHDIGDSMPGTVGDSQGTIHDRRGGPSFDPDDEVIAYENSHSNGNSQSNQQQKDSNSSTTESDTEEAEPESKRMKYAKKYGDSWPEDRQRRFLCEHDTSAQEMGWKLTE